jgi:two-component system, response regulator RegA
MTEQGAEGTHVLLLEDETAILDPMGTYFRNLGCSVDMAREPEEAGALVSHRRYDVAILDVRVARLGGHEGLDVLREIRRRDHATRIIVLTGFVSPELEEEAFALGADAVLPKPQSLPQLARLAMPGTAVPGGDADRLPTLKVNP